MKPRTNPIILALDPGTRYIGVAVLAGRGLAYHGVRTLQAEQTPHGRLEEVRRLVARLIRHFRPEILAVEKPFFARDRNAALLNVLVDEIRAVGREHGVRVVALAPSTVRKRVCGSGQATKAEVARAVAARFPELKALLQTGGSFRERYYGNLFDAVAVGLAAIRDRDDRAAEGS